MEWQRRTICVALMAVVFACGLAVAGTAPSLQWIARYDGPEQGPEQAAALAVDPHGYAYVTGRSTSPVTMDDIVTIKYSPRGEAIWTRRYNGAGNGEDRPTALRVDAQGNVYVVGTNEGPGSGLNFVTIKYGPAGELLWVQTYDGPACGWDPVSDIELDGLGNVYVIGVAEVSPGDWDYATIKYSPVGEQLWVATESGPGGSFDRPVDLVVDGEGCAYVAGECMDFNAHSACMTVKYDPDGAVMWTREHSDAGRYFARALALDAAGFVYVTGGCGPAQYDPDEFAFFTVKYAANGDVLWQRTYDQPDLTYSIGRDIEVDALGDVIVTGECATLKYSPSGELLWFMDTEASLLRLDRDGNVYLGAPIRMPRQPRASATLKYSPEGEHVWSREYLIDANQPNQLQDFAVDRRGNLYATGSTGAESYTDFATVRYVVDYAVHFDLKPGTCENAINLNGWHSAGRSVLPAAILGTPDLDVHDIDATSLRLAGQAPLRWSYEDVATPVGDPSEGFSCAEHRPDGILDMTLKFDKFAVMQSLDARPGAPGHAAFASCDRPLGEALLELSGELTDATPIKGYDGLRFNGHAPGAPHTIAGAVASELGPNRPNPFNASTTLSFTLAEASEVRLDVFNVIGQRVAELATGFFAAGEHRLTWDASRVPSGVYFYRIEAGELVSTRRMLLLK